jgi:hypothetical protein
MKLVVVERKETYGLFKGMPNQKHPLNLFRLMDMKRGFLFRKSFEKGIIYGHNFR